MSQWSNNNPAQNQVDTWLSYWNLLMSLVSRDIRARYRRTFLGPLWAIIPAILYTVILSFLSGLVGASSEGMPRLAFVMSATVPWTFLQSSVVRIPHGVLANGTILRKMPVPRQIFPFVVVLTTFFDFLMSSIVLVVVLQIFQIPISWAWLWLPALVCMTGFLAWAIGIGLSAVTIYRRDVLHGIQYIMQVWLFISPVMVSSREILEDWPVLHALNPAAGIIDGFRRVLLFGESPNVEWLLSSLVLSCLVLAVAYPLYHVMSRYFADVL
jgi:ABC-type polysaccharide/polyol phosphate export permease